METLIDPKSAIARSSFPSLSKSATLTATGPAPAGYRPDCFRSVATFPESKHDSGRHLQL